MAKIQRKKTQKQCTSPNSPVMGRSKKEGALLHWWGSVERLYRQAETCFVFHAMFYPVCNAFPLKGKFCYKMETIRISVQKAGRAAYRCPGDGWVTDVRSQLPAPRWELERRMGGGTAGGGPGLGEDGGGSRRLPQESFLNPRSGLSPATLCWGLKQQRGTSAAQPAQGVRASLGASTWKQA